MHRDLQPENFLFHRVEEDALFKATDFGLSVFYKPDLQQACKEFGLSELHLDEMIKEIDQDNDEQIDYVRTCNGGIGRRTMRSTFNLGEALGFTTIGSKESD